MLNGGQNRLPTLHFWNLIKGHFSHAIPKGGRISPSRNKRRERRLWKRRFRANLLCGQDDFNNHLDILIGIPSNMAEYNALSTGRIQVFIDLWSGVFTRLTGSILEISIFMQTNDSNDAPPIVGTSYGPTKLKTHSALEEALACFSASS